MTWASNQATASKPPGAGAADEGGDGLVVVPGVGQHGRARRPGPGAAGRPPWRRRCRRGRRARRTAARPTLVAVATSICASFSPTTGSSQCSRTWRSSVKGRLSAAAHDRQHGQHHQRQGHDPRRLVGLVAVPAAGPCRRGARWPARCRLARSARRPAPVAASAQRLAEEHHEHLAAHVEGGEQRGDQADGPQDLALPAGAAPRRTAGSRPSTRSPENGGTPAIGQPADDERGRRDRHELAQAAHAAHVLLAVHAVDDRAGPEEQQRLEEGVGDHVEDGGHVGARPPPPGTCSRAG